MQGHPEWYGLIGSRKVGKTSLLLELERRNRRKGLVFAILDSFEERPVSPAIFKRYALRVVDAFLAQTAGVSLEALSLRPSDFRSKLFESKDFIRLSAPVRAAIVELVEDRPFDQALVESALKLPQQLAETLDRRCVVAWDEFQELGSIVYSRKKIDIFALARAIWQKHDRVCYLISGSRRTMLNELMTSPASPFFQHFSLLDVGPMPTEQAVALLRDCSPKGRTIPQPLAKRAVEILSGQPFYLQLFGDTLTRSEPPYDEAAFKGAIFELLFSRTGRLSLYFQREFQELVGKANTLAAVLNALSDGAKKLSEIANATKASSASTVHYIERLQDAVLRREDGLYEIADPVFALWLKWNKPGGTVVPMSVVGDEAERLTARALAEMGFELVYQSRASRGAFDLLALRSGTQLGVQVKRSALPLRFKKGEWNRMQADAKRFGWRFVVAAVDNASNAVTFLDPKGARISRAITLTDRAAIENLLAWL